MADPIAERGLVEPPVARLLVGHRLAGRDRDDVAALRPQHPRDADGVVPLVPPGAQSVAEILTEIGFLPRPGRPDGRQHLERIAHARLERRPRTRPPARS